MTGSDQPLMGTGTVGAFGTQAVTVSREELFDQVWTTPMSRLAQSYGISGNGLAKICNRLNVPYPPRGYWAKKAAGKKVVQYRLPHAKDGTRQAVMIRPTPAPVPRANVSPEMQQQIEDAKHNAGVVIVPDRLIRPHPIIAGWLKEREEKRASARRERNPWMRNLIPSDWTETEKRRHRILDTLFKAVEKQGIRIKQPDRFTEYFEASGERIDYKLREKHKQVRIPKTAEETKRLLHGEKTWRQELHPTGLLAFSIETYLPTLSRREWSDTAAQKLEDQVGDILASLILAGPLLIEQRRQREEDERRRREEEHRRQQEAERRRLDDNRWRRFTELAQRWQQADEVRRFLDALDQRTDVAEVLTNGEPVSEWLSWARARLAEFDPLEAGPARVFEDVLKVTNWAYRE